MDAANDSPVWPHVESKPTIPRLTPSIELLLESHRRGYMPPGISFLTVMEASYCLDAPTLIPGGGMTWEELGHDMGGLPVQIEVEREA